MISKYLFALEAAATEATGKLGTLELIFGIAVMAMALFLVVAVLMQSSKDKSLSGSISGSSSETFFSKSKTLKKDKVLSMLTLIVSIIFTVLVVVMYIFVA